jgi:hypothetical protein
MFSLEVSLRRRYMIPAIVLASACALAGGAAAVRAAPQAPAQASAGTAGTGLAGTGPSLWLPGGPAIEVSGGTSMVVSGGGTLQDTLVSLAIGSSSYQIPVDALPYLGHGLEPGPVQHRQPARRREVRQARDPAQLRRAEAFDPRRHDHQLR